MRDFDPGVCDDPFTSTDPFWDSNPNGQPQAYISLPDPEELEVEKEKADELIDFLISINYLIDTQDGQRPPTYGDIVTLPRHFIYSWEDAEETEDRPTYGAINHLDDDRWYDNHRPAPLGIESTITTRLSLWELWNDHAAMIARTADIQNKSKLKVMLEYLEANGDKQIRLHKKGNRRICQRSLFKPSPTIMFSQPFAAWAKRDGFTPMELLVKLWKGWFCLRPKSRKTQTTEKQMKFALQSTYVEQTSTEKEILDVVFSPVPRMRKDPRVCTPSPLMM
jgi:hypothetical protein